MVKEVIRKQMANAVYVGFEDTLRATADKLRGNLDAAEYMHVGQWVSSVGWLDH